tara:strand:+ start:183 stop:314 length:132 start_codon:yes stop_codon:yes gene_type:complete
MAAPVMASLSRIPINKIGATQVGAVAQDSRDNKINITEKMLAH